MRTLEEVDRDISKAIEDGDLGSHADLLDEKDLVLTALDRKRMKGTAGTKAVSAEVSSALGCCSRPVVLAGGRLDPCRMPRTPFGLKSCRCISGQMNAKYGMCGFRESLVSLFFLAAELRVGMHSPPGSARHQLETQWLVLLTPALACRLMPCNLSSCVF
jgi:hypothetical protein